MELDAARDGRALGDDRSVRTSIDELAVDARPRADMELTGAHDGVAADRTAQPHVAARGLQITGDRAVKLHPPAGDRRAALDHRRGTDLDLAARDPRVAGDDRIHRYFAARGVEIVADAATNRNLAPGHHQIALHFARDIDLPAGEQRIALRPARSG